MRNLIVPILVLGGLTTFPAERAEAQPVCKGTRLEVKTQPLNSKPYVDVTLDSKTGPWLVDYGLTQTQVSEGIWQKPADRKKLSLSGFSFPTLGTSAREFSSSLAPGKYKRLDCTTATSAPTS